MIPETQTTTAGYKREVTASPRILIVEDELLVAWHLESLSREHNLEVCGLVPDGIGAIEQASDLDVDLILMDIRLAGRMDGIEAAQRIREQRDTPIIFITAHGDPTTRAHIHRLLPDAPVLAKPISSDQLRDAINTALGACD
ncbi:response regulator [Pseudorhodoplanes sp.]|jgi:CheY-like chemotaxis protein|uniref:response regulator n=1 Tax=Pseudorhodoplanes sp. TaxID=1934341 RepID=UPI002CD5A182|nr:response regulator [Pseudorhodoplanes sp.]HWV40492.1 response regulator [Pseudorhodoplanes sp.]